MKGSWKEGEANFRFSWMRPLRNGHLCSARGFWREFFRMRQGKVSIIPGHDGVYGKIDLFPEKKEGEGTKEQLKLF